MKCKIEWKSSEMRREKLRVNRNKNRREQMRSVKLKTRKGGKMERDTKNR